MKNILIAILSAISLPSVAQTAWPNLPLLCITTQDSVMPTRDIIEAPEGCVGVGITNNEYVNGRLVIVSQGDTVYDSGEYEKGKSGMRMKIRGNTTGAYNTPSPYKLKLSKKADLLMRSDKKLRHKTWAIINPIVWNTAMTDQESDILHLFGPAVCRAAGEEWTPAGEYVCVEANGQFLGFYYLSETVEQGEGRVAIDDTGFLIENDAYWWKPGETYFKGPHQSQQMGYTYKYPDPEDVESSVLQGIESHMSSFEDSLYLGGDISRLADLRSFARWVLIHDIMGSNDAAGSNMFIMKKDMDALNPYSTLLQMASPWDFDTSFKADNSEWSGIHTSASFYYPELFRRSAFVDEYVSLWNDIKATLYSDVADTLRHFAASQGADFDKALAMHYEKYGISGQISAEAQVTEVLGKLSSRLEALSLKIDGLTGIRAAHIPAAVPVARYDMLGRRLAPTCRPSISIVRLADGSVRKVTGR